VTEQTYIERAPRPALAHLVASAWIQQSGDEPYHSRHIPNGAVELLCALGSEPQVVGPITEPRVEVLAPGTTIVGVRLRPGAAPAVLGMPAAEVVDLAIDLWDAPALGERLAGARSPEHALNELERHVFGRTAGEPDPLIAEAVKQLMPWCLDDVTSLTASLYISETQLRRRCRDAVGLGPKTLHRLLRFQGFLALVQRSIATGRDESLAQLALDAGYADQPHLNRECLRLTGVSPRTFLRETQESCVSGHDHAASYAPLLQGRGGAAGEPQRVGRPPAAGRRVRAVGALAV
jgi:AraC-like DNA-binding protein